MWKLFGHFHLLDQRIVEPLDVGQHNAFAALLVPWLGIEVALCFRVLEGVAMAGVDFASHQGEDFLG